MCIRDSTLTWGYIASALEGERAETAKNQPMTEEMLRKPILKTGSTAFAFDKLEVETDKMCIRDSCRGVMDSGGYREAADFVLIATGGLSYASTGATGDGYHMAENAGHTLVPPRPSLVPMETEEDWCRELMGLSLRNVSVVLKKGRKKIYEDFGEMLFTHFGVSGPLILSGSAHCGKLKDFQDVTLTIDLKPALTAEQMDGRLLRIFEENKNKQFRNSLGGLLPNKMISIIIDLSGIDPYKQVNLVSKEERALSLIHI